MDHRFHSKPSKNLSGFWHYLIAQMEMATQKVTDNWNHLSGLDNIDYLANNITIHSSDISHLYKIGHRYAGMWTYDIFCNQSLREKCPYSEFLWSVFSPNAGKYGPGKLQIRTCFTQSILLSIIPSWKSSKFSTNTA